MFAMTLSAGQGHAGRVTVSEPSKGYSFDVPPGYVAKHITAGNGQEIAGRFMLEDTLAILGLGYVDVSTAGPVASLSRLHIRNFSDPSDSLLSYVSEEALQGCGGIGPTGWTLTDSVVSMSRYRIGRRKEVFEAVVRVVHRPGMVAEGQTVSGYVSLVAVSMLVRRGRVILLLRSPCYGGSRAEMSAWFKAAATEVCQTLRPLR